MFAHVDNFLILIFSFYFLSTKNNLTLDKQHVFKFIQFFWKAETTKDTHLYVIAIFVFLLLFLFIFLCVGFHLFLEYGRGCQDIGCLPSEVCVMSQDSCSFGQRDGKDCGTYPTCKKQGAATTNNRGQGKMTLYFLYYFMFWLK